MYLQIAALVYYHPFHVSTRSIYRTFTKSLQRQPELAVDTITLLNPDPGHSPIEMSRERYDAFKRAILSVLPESGRGISFRELAVLVRDAISEDKLNHAGSIIWHVTSIKKDLVERGLIASIEGSSPERLLRTGTDNRAR